MGGYQVDEATAEEIEAERATYGPLAEALRRLNDLSIRTLVGAEQVAEATALLEQAAAVLSAEVDPEPYGVRFSKLVGGGRNWGNSVVGVRNPVAPPLTITHQGGVSSSDFELGAQYEGPPGFVHGGVTALLLDQMLGEAAAATGRPGMTGTLTIRYRKPTPLGRLSAEARVDRVEGIKTYAVGHIAGPDGVCAEAEGVFILPRWARDKDAPRRFE